VKFDMGASTLGNLSQQTSGASDDLGGLVRQLVAAAQPLEGRFNGAGRAAFDHFKAHTDEITADLNGSLARIVHGQGGMNRSFVTGDGQMADNAAQAQGAAPFEAARFGASR